MINFALWISEQAQFKNFGSMLATICFFTFVVSLFHMKIERDQYRKNLELEYKEFSEQQMSRYMAEIQSLYSIVRLSLIHISLQSSHGLLMLSLGLFFLRRLLVQFFFHRQSCARGEANRRAEVFSGDLRLHARCV